MKNIFKNKKVDPRYKYIINNKEVLLDKETFDHIRNLKEQLAEAKAKSNRIDIQGIVDSILVRKDCAVTINATDDEVTVSIHPWNTFEDVEAN